ncbi:alpha/beta hydrolase [Streptomyces sp. NPDC057718]|uniref:alpha/beta hydrolase n=1 Tax=Streptomyces sp. NPDC057718 TaxID=3346225 RepID=UPI00368AD0E7
MVGPDEVAGPGAAVLVHGLYHRPEHFDLVAEGLRAASIDVVVPGLHRGSLAADTEAVQDAVDALAEAYGTPPLVLGHSYGGSVITGLRGAGHLVYLAAFVPDAGESAAGLGGATAELRAAVVPGGPDGATSLHPGRAADVLYADCPGAAASRAVDLLRPQGPGCGRGIPERQAWKDTGSTYVVCALDRAIDPGLQRSMAARCGSVRVWRTGHSPFVSRPGLVVDLVRERIAGPSADG